MRKYALIIACSLFLMNPLFAQSNLIDVKTNFDLVEGQNVTSLLSLIMQKRNS